MKHNYFQEEKLKYEDIEIPDELLLMVRQTVAADRRKKAAAWRNRVIRMAGSVAAILFLCLTIGVNSSYAFAETAIKIPVVKSVAKAVIVRSYKADIIALDEENRKAKEEKEVTEQKPEETTPSVSDNDTVSENEASEPPAVQEPEEVLEGIDAWKAEMTPEKLKEITEIYTPDMEERYANAPEKLRTILLAELPEKDISLYGYHENGKVTGTALRVKDTCQYYDWNYMNSTKKLPEISFADADGDGEDELAILLYNGEPQMETISKEDIEEPGKTAGENGESSENSDGNKNKEATGETASGQDKTAAGDTSEKKAAETGTENTSTNKTSESTENTTANKMAETPENASADKTVGTSENTAAGKETDPADAGKAKSSALETSGNGAQENDSADNTDKTAAESDKPAVSGNDIKISEEPEEVPVQQAGELWIISLKDENWSASVLSVSDYESQIIHQLKAEYDEAAGSVQLYFMEDAFGKPEKLSDKERENLTYEAVNLAPEREFATDKGLFLYFGMEASFVNEDGEEISFPLSIKLKAEIRLEEGSLVIENIKER